MAPRASHDGINGIVIQCLRVALAIISLWFLWIVLGWLGAIVARLLATVQIDVSVETGAFMAAVVVILIIAFLLWRDQGTATVTAEYTFTTYTFKPNKCTSTTYVTLKGPYPKWAGGLTPFSQDVEYISPKSPLVNLTPLLQKLLDATLTPADIPELEQLILKDFNDPRFDKFVEIARKLSSGVNVSDAERQELEKILQDRNIALRESLAKEKQPARPVAVDDQTGIEYALTPEQPPDMEAARFSFIYLLVAMLFLFWLAFDIWIGQFSLANLFRYRDTQRLLSPTFRLAAFALIGGALGAIVNGIRSILVWHSERFAFGRHFVWKYITAPFQGGALALFTYALIRGGVGGINGDSVQATVNAGQILSVFGIGVLAGYGSQKAFVWLDAQVNHIFQVEAPLKVTVPWLIGKTRAEAVELLNAASLKLGDVTEQDPEDPAQVGKVTDQSPPAQKTAISGAPVNITLASVKEPQPAHPIDGKAAG
jgi:hypothetical protein